jgi:2-methylcitrate dehydratase PrpD
MRARCAGSSTRPRRSPPATSSGGASHIEKGFVFAGMPARNGVTAAVVKRSGWGGVDDIFSGSDNFFQAYAPKAKLEQIADKLGERYEIALTDINKWSVGSPFQAPLDVRKR